MVTPIEKSISEIKQMIEVNNLPFDPLVNRCLQILEGNKEYEKSYHRDIAEKAIRQGIEIGDMLKPKYFEENINEYLNENHPL